jgi:glycosyltransferase involved in cell wall biosynthesis
MIEKLSVLFVTRKWPPAVGGMETYAHRLSQELAKLAEVEVVALPGRMNGQPPSTLALLLFPLKVACRWFSRRQAPDILHLGDVAIWPFGLLAVLSGGKTKVALSAHGTDVSYQRRGGITGRLYGAYLKLGARFLRHASVIGNSRATAEVAAETGWPVAGIVPLATDMTARPAGAGIHNGRILFAGRLIKLKGCSWFIREVLPKLPQSMTLDVAGAIWDEAEGEALADPRVNFLGSLDKPRLAQAYREALCVVMPNVATETGQHEGFGLVAPEAAAAGGIVLAARRDGLIDAIIEGETGILVESGASQAWASVICEIAEWTEERRETFVARAQDTVKREFAWRRVARDTFETYLRAGGR